MRILQVVTTLGYGGTETYVARLCRGLVDIGQEVAVLTEGGPLEDLFQESGVQVMRRPLDRMSLPGVAAEIASKGFEIINAHKYCGGRVGQVLSRHARIPWVMTVHGPRSFLKRALVRYWSPQVICLSSADKGGIGGLLGVSAERVFVSFPAVDIERYRRRQVHEAGCGGPLPKSESVTIVHVSRFTNRKGRIALRLIEAMPRVIAVEPKARLRIVGTGEMFERIKAAACVENRAAFVTVEGPRPDLSDLFNTADVVVATAATAMEALACGAPLIAAGRTGYIGPVDQANFDSALGLLFGDHGRCGRETSASTLAADILRILDERRHWRSQGEVLAGRMATEFNPTAAAKSVLAVYGKVLAGGVR